MYYAIVKNNNVERGLFSPESIVSNDVTYPKNIFTVWSVDELIAIGIYPYSEVKDDGRFYDFGSLSYDIQATEVIGTYVSTAKNLNDIKEQMISEVKRTASQYLSTTDWLAIREYEGGDSIPDDVKTKRATVRTESNTKETEINTLTSISEIENYDTDFVSLPKS